MYSIVWMHVISDTGRACTDINTEEMGVCSECDVHNIVSLRYGIRIVRGDVVGTRPEVNVVPAETGEVRGLIPDYIEMLLDCIQTHSTL
jgi:hypothetical protein